MRNFFNTIFVILLFAGMCYLVERYNIGRVPPGLQSEKPGKTITIYQDTGTHTIDSIKVPEPYTVYRDTGHAYIRKVENLATITKDSLINLYISIYGYSDTIYNNDSSLVIFLDDKISMNRIIKRAMQYRHTYPTKIINETVLPPVEYSRFMPGLLIGAGDKKYSFGPAVKYEFQNCNSAALSYDAINKKLYLNYFFNLK